MKCVTPFPRLAPLAGVPLCARRHTAGSSNLIGSLVKLSLTALLVSGTVQTAFAASGSTANPPGGMTSHDMSGMKDMKGMSGGSGPAGAAQAHPAANVQVSQAWIRWLPSQLPAAGYMVLENTGSHAIQLIGVSSPDYADVMLHRTVHNGSTTTMEMAHTLALPPHEKVAISPGGYHFMLEKPRRLIAPGGNVELNLQFSDGGALRLTVPVSPPTRTP